MKGTTQILVKDSHAGCITSKSFQSLEGSDIDYLTLDEANNSLEWARGKVVRTCLRHSFLEFTIKDIDNMTQFKLICDPIHQFMMSDRNYRTAGQLEIGDILMSNSCSADGGFKVSESHCQIRDINWIVFNAYPQRAYTIHCDKQDSNCVIYSNKELLICKLSKI